MTTEPMSVAKPAYEHNRPGARPWWGDTGGSLKGWRWDTHVHPGLEVGVVLGGDQIGVTCGGFAFTVLPGDAWMCNAWEPHATEQRAAGTSSVTVTFLPEFLGEEMLGSIPWLTLFAVPPDQRPRARSDEARGRVLEVGRRLADEVSGNRVWQDSMVRLEVLRLLLELARAWDPRDVPEPNGHVPVAFLARVMPALSLAHSRPWHRVSVAEAAAACGMSVPWFHSVFRRALGVSFTSFCLRARVSFVAHRLANTDRTVVALAGDAGFVDDCHLRRHFARHYGCTPQEFRDRCRTAGHTATARRRRLVSAGQARARFSRGEQP
jgi:AraC-like DNA-binding protein